MEARLVSCQLRRGETNQRQSPGTATEKKLPAENADERREKISGAEERKLPADNADERREKN